MSVQMSKKNRLKKICVYCGSGSGNKLYYEEEARYLGRLFVEQGIELIYGGARVGIMGAIADEVMNEGGKVTGVIPQNLVRREVAHDGVMDLRVVDSMHERKALMAELSDGFIALPGGLGTLEELSEILTWAQLGLHTKPTGVLNIGGYYDRLIGFLDYAVDEGFVKPVNRSLLLIRDKAEELLNDFEEYQSPVHEKWLRSDEI